MFHRMAVRRDFLDELTNMELMERYRLDRGGLQFLDNRLSNVLSPRTDRSRSLSSLYKILITLRYLATGSTQLNYGDLHDVSQPTVSRVIAQVTDAMSTPEFSQQYIKFPSTPDKIKRTKEEFYGIANFPNILGVIDGTHVQIKAPRNEEPSFVNRMGYHSINTQVVFDAEYRILDIAARWPGATHDSRILRESGLWVLMEGGHLPVAGHNYLIGDSGYPCKRWLLTPYLHPQAGSQTDYNKAHKQTRTVVERGIGQLKRRWGVLHGEITLEPVKACKVIISCGVLHNICKARNIPLLDIVPDGNQVNINQNGYNGPQEGLRYRDYIANTYF
ncbi:putative nuclease HARBI1 [Mercenaria mercenaria]|uniref:putative nuclease HARBI1 n=1 Tax=Mercenaria mercenaria TaxID=6596 RepID=UPI00234E7518|nr:putative nuclease HARBI1 [Mercenaria mercenaria]